MEIGDKNRMNFQSLAIVFGPTLLKPEKETGNIAIHTVYQSQIVELILMEYNSIFGRWAAIYDDLWATISARRTPPTFAFFFFLFWTKTTLRFFFLHFCEADWIALELKHFGLIIYY